MSDDFRIVELSPETAKAPVVIVTGPTATGKTHLAVQLAQRFGGEIISADSRQLYRGLDLGTGKDLDEYICADGTQIPHHLIDVTVPSVRFDLFKYLDLARQALNDIVARGRMPIICGGTPLYVSALLNGYAMIGGEPDWQLRDELDHKTLPELIAILRDCASDDLIARTDLTQNRRVIRAIEIAHHPECSIKSRPLENTLILAPKFTREEVRARIALRLDARLNAGMIDEVKQLHDEGAIPWEQLDWFGLEYRYISRFLRGILSYEQMYNELLNHIRQFAKRQDIWFRKIEREGHVIHWLVNNRFENASALTNELLAVS